MAKRAAICVGVNCAGSMTPLQAAVMGARDFESWTKAQGCDTTLLIDGIDRRVSVSEVFDAVEQVVNAGTYGQLIVYFSGHGILIAPGAEYWLLSRAPQNPNEAVNVSRSVVEARNAGIPHVVLISDACRSSVSGPPLSGVTGSVIFPSRPVAPNQGEVDVYYATRPGDPAYEVPEAQATQRYRGIFTDALLKVVRQPPASMVETIQIGNHSKDVISSRRMKNHLEAIVPLDAVDIDLKLRQAPQLIVETALPKYFAEVQLARGLAPTIEPQPPRTVDRALSALAATHFYELTRGAPIDVDAGLAKDTGLLQEIEAIAATRGRAHFETMTGFSIFGVGEVDAEAQRWVPDAPFAGDNERRSWHVRLHTPGQDQRKPSTIVFGFDGKTGAALAILPGFIGTVIVTKGRVTSVSYVPSDQNRRYKQYVKRQAALSAMKAFAAVASRNGRFVVENENAEDFAKRIRQDKGIDPTMGLYAAYAYAQVGAYKDVYSIFRYMSADEIEVPTPFDVVMLATHHKPDAYLEADARFAPFCPMLAQGWALLGKGDPMYASVHAELRPHLVPALWTTLSSAGVRIARGAIE